MSGGFEVYPESIVNLASAYDQIAADIRALDVLGPLAVAGRGLPGSETAVALLTLSVTLPATVSVSAQHVGSLANTARVTAATYVHAEAMVREQLRSLSRAQVAL